MIKKYIVQSYIGNIHQSLLVGHHGSIYLPLFLRTLFALAMLWWIITAVYTLRWMHHYLQLSFATITIFLYWYFLLRFINDYLDSFIANERWLTLFRRDGMFHYTVQQFEREKIDMISFEKTTFWHKLRNTGNIIITLDHDVSFTIEHIGNPQKIVNMRWAIKWERTKKIDHTDDESSEDKFTILVETLGEVIKDYMHRDHDQYPGSGQSNYLP